MSITLINTLSQPLKSAVKFVAHNEQASGLSTSRFIQDTCTNLLPKAALARSKEDLAENSFLELSESGLVYYAPALIGEKIARKAYSKNLSGAAKELVAVKGSELIKNKNVMNKQVLPVKAAIALSALFIPLTEFTLNYLKNLMTLKVFKKSDFTNVVNLDNKKEDSAQQKKVRENAHKNIKRAVTVFATSIALGTLIAKKGTNSKTLQHLSEAILAPGTKFFKKNQKAENFFNKYFSLDFDTSKGKLVLSKGQLTASVLVGMMGYLGAAKDRGKQNFLETLFRMPIVGLYVITGSEPFEKLFKKTLQKAGKCKELIGKDLKVPNFDELKSLAEKLSKQNNTSINEEFKKLAKQKVLISGAPFLFSMLVMGLFVTGISNIFTRYRFIQEQKLKNAPNNISKETQTPKAFEAFLK